jgi:hypothetical protein
MRSEPSLRIQSLPKDPTSKYCALRTTLSTYKLLGTCKLQTRTVNKHPFYFIYLIFLAVLEFTLAKQVLYHLNHTPRPKHLFNLKKMWTNVSYNQHSWAQVTSKQFEQQLQKRCL